MKKEELEKIKNSIIEKVGKENAGKIADDIGLLITDNAKTLKEIDTMNNRIKKLEEDKERLITTNGNLLQQVAMGEEEEIERKTEKKEHKELENMSFRDFFDDRGNFLK